MALGGRGAIQDVCIVCGLSPLLCQSPVAGVEQLALRVLHTDSGFVAGVPGRPADVNTLALQTLQARSKSLGDQMCARIDLLESNGLCWGVSAGTRIHTSGHCRKV